MSRPLRTLEGFEKVYLSAGESRHVELFLPMRAFAFFDVEAHCWRVEAGRFMVEAGFSAADRPLAIDIDLAEACLPV